MKFQIPYQSKKSVENINLSNTLINLINAQDGINEQESNFSKIINQAGWNKRAGRANFEAIINKQGRKDKKHKGKPWQSIYNWSLHYLPCHLANIHEIPTSFVRYLVKRSKNKFNKSREGKISKFNKWAGENSIEQGGKNSKINQQGCAFIR